MTYDALVERNLALPRSEVFAALCDFGGLKSLVPDAVARCECVGVGVGAVRTITLADGGRLVERLDVAHDETVFVYTLIENDALPLEHYCAVVTLADTADGGTAVCFGSNWTPAGAEEEEIRAALEALYGLLLDGIVARAADAENRD